MAEVVTVPGHLTPMTCAPHMATREHARAEWAYFRYSILKRPTLRRMWALHYARVRGWTDHGPLIIDP